jgi:hypothetical protein
MEADVPAKWLVLDPQVVQQALSRLIEIKVHPHFVGYLSVLRTARAAGKQENLHPDFADFFERFLKVSGAPAQRPYLQPFADSKIKGKRWSPFFNVNVAGSYAPSSLREDVAPFLKVVTIKGYRAKATYSLDPDHNARALKHLLHGKKLPVASLAIFLYRDYGFNFSSWNQASVINAFRDEFGFRDSEAKEQAAFDLLLHDDSSQFDLTKVHEVEGSGS